MTPKEKAKELIEKFLDHVKSEKPPKPNGYYHAKACAIICVDEIINEYKKLIKIFNGHFPEIEYWQSVKEETNNF